MVVYDLTSGASWPLTINSAATKCTTASCKLYVKFMMAEFSIKVYIEAINQVLSASDEEQMLTGAH